MSSVIKILLCFQRTNGEEELALQEDLMAERKDLTSLLNQYNSEAKLIN